MACEPPFRTGYGSPVPGRLFKRRSELAPPSVHEGWASGRERRQWDAPSGFVVGESHYAGALQALAGPPRPAGYLIPVAVEIVREPNNPYDQNAFRVEVEGRKVGHLSRHLASQLARPLDRAGCERFTACGVIRGGSERRPNLGVHVWLDRLLTDGPQISQADDTGTVKNWPPRDDEGV